MMSTQLRRSARTALAQRLIAVAVVSIGFVALSASSARGCGHRAATGRRAARPRSRMVRRAAASSRSSNLALMGQYDMGRIMGSTAAYDAMNAQMQAIYGCPRRAARVPFMGRRLGSCATGNGPVAFGTMMGMMGTSEMGASYGSADPAGGYGSMMGGYGFNQAAGNGGTSVGAIVAIVLGSLVLLALVALIFVLLTRRTPVFQTNLDRPDGRRLPRRKDLHHGYDIHRRTPHD